MLVSILLILSLNLLVVIQNEAAMCQRRRIIHTPKLRLWCSGYKNVLRIQINSAEDIEETIFTKNDVTVVDEQSFLLKNNSVKKVLLDFNLINVVQGDAFKQFPDLELIDLSHNKVRSLQPTTFSSNKKLKTIDLSWNFLEVLHIEFVVHFNNLEKFLLSNNSLRVCENKTKETLTYLDKKSIEIYYLPRCTGGSGNLEGPIETNNIRYFDISQQPPEINLARSFKFQEIINYTDLPYANFNGTEKEASIAKSERQTWLIYWIHIVTFLLLLITAIVVMLAIKLYKKNHFPSRRTKTISGTYLLYEEPKDSRPEDPEGYLVPTVPNKIPQYLEVLGDNPPGEVTSNQPLNPGCISQNIYEEVQDTSFYNANIKRNRLQPYAVTTLLKKS